MIDYDRDGEGKKRKRNAASGGFLRKTYHQLLHVTNHCRNFAPLQPTQQLGEGRRTSNAIVISLYIERNICNSHF